MLLFAQRCGPLVYSYTLPWPLPPSQTGIGWKPFKPCCRPDCNTHQLTLEYTTGWINIKARLITDNFSLNLTLESVRYLLSSYNSCVHFVQCVNIYIQPKPNQSKWHSRYVTLYHFITFLFGLIFKFQTLVGLDVTVRVHFYLFNLILAALTIR